VLGRDDRALDDEQVDAAVEHGLGELHGPLRVSEAATVTPASRICLIRAVMRSLLIGSA
jgi:hypothetical protein